MSERTFKQKGAGVGSNFDYDSLGMTVSATNGTSPQDSVAVITIVTSVAKRFLLSFQGTLSFSASVQNVGGTLAYNIDSGAEEINCAQTNGQPNPDLPIPLPIGAAVYTSVLAPGSHTFQIKMYVSSIDAGASVTASGTLYVIGLT
jgi:hypothetical protein